VLRATLWTLAIVCASITSASALPQASLEAPNRGTRSNTEAIPLAPGDRELIGRALIGEAAGEGQIGMAAVAHVIRNRMALVGVRVQNAKAFGLTVPQVLQQFDAMNRRRGGAAYRLAWATSLQHPSLMEALSIVDAVFNAPSDDPTGGALFYYNPATVRTPAWVEHFAPYNDRQIGNHRFVGLAPSTEVGPQRAFGNFISRKSPKPSTRASGLQG
jgi:spore germination cell wall hydrolase CwlJ-like protein